MGQNQWYHFGVGAPPILVFFFFGGGDWDVHWRYKGFDPWPSKPAAPQTTYPQKTTHRPKLSTSCPPPCNRDSLQKVLLTRLWVKNRVTPKWHPGQMETMPKFCGPYPGGLILTHTHMVIAVYMGASCIEDTLLVSLTRIQSSPPRSSLLFAAKTSFQKV